MGVSLHVFPAAEDAMHHDCGWGRALTHLLLAPSYQGPLNQLIGLQMVQLDCYCKIQAVKPCKLQTYKPLLHAQYMSNTAGMNNLGIHEQPDAPL